VLIYEPPLIRTALPEVSPSSAAQPEGISFTGPRGDRLKALVRVHLVLGGVLTVAMVFIPIPPAPHSTLLIALYSVFFSQFMLLVIWSGLASPHFDSRFNVISAGGVYLAIPCGVFPEIFAIRHASIAESIVLATVGAIIALPFYAFGWWFAIGVCSGIISIYHRFVHVRCVPELTDEPARTQWSLRELLMLTAGACVIFGLGRAAVPSDNSPRPNLVAPVLYVAIVLSQGLALTWATLSKGDPRWRILLTLFLATITVLAFPLAIGVTGNNFVFTTVLLLSPCPIVIATLLVVRSCGYRLVPRSAES
jgi:hypothetical protein